MTNPLGTGTPVEHSHAVGTSGHGQAAAALGALGWTSFLMPLAVSVLANLTWGLGTGSWVLIVAGLVSPLLLVLAVERWRALPGLTGWARGVQVAGMAVVAAVAAGWSWVHTTDLLLDATRTAEGLPDTAALADLPWLLVVLCIAAPLAVDGLAVLSVLTLAAAPVTGHGQRGHGPGEEGWGPAASVAPVPIETAERARRLSSVPGQRTKRELEAAARDLGVPRKARESVEDFRARVEAAERARAQDGATA